MSELALPGQLRAALLRWTLFLAPLLLLLGTISGLVAGSGAGNPWFMSLTKPALYPPPATFGIVWTALYLMMGLALAMVVSARGGAGRKLAIAVFAGQFALNLIWPPLFFAMHRIGMALTLLVVLDLAVILTVALFHKLRPVAAWLLLPYLAWCLFATLLNWQILRANPLADADAIDVAALLIGAPQTAI